jgi:carbonic anhydrase
MELSRRKFASGLGWLAAGLAGSDAVARSEGLGWDQIAANDQHEDHSHLPMTTHASGNSENQLAPAEEVWKKLLAGNQRFVTGKTLSRDVVARREAVKAGQQPQAVVLACSDSRVTPSVVFDQDLGEIFEVRNAGNVADPVVLGTIEYALLHLPVRVLVILGHQKCGAVAAAVGGDKMPTANLQAVVDRISPAIMKLKGDRKSPEFLQQAVEANVLHCAVDFLSNSPVILRETAANNVEIIKAVYSLETGQVTRLTG